MKKLTIILFSLFYLSSLSAQVSLEGIWHTGDENTKIETYKKDGAWFGKIISSDNPKAKLGTDILQGFQKQNGEWQGKIFAARRGKILDATIQTSEKKLTINVSAGFFRNTLEWKRDPE